MMDDVPEKIVSVCYTPSKPYIVEYHGLFPRYKGVTLVQKLKMLRILPLYLNDDVLGYGYKCTKHLN